MLENKQIHLSKIIFFILAIGFGFILDSAPLMIISGALGFLIAFERYLKIKIPTIMSIIFVLFVIATLVLGSELNFYEKFLWWDDLLHTFYGGAFAFIGFLLIQYLSYKRGISNDILIICLFSLCFSIAFGAIWEIYEFSYDTIMGGNMQRTDQGSGVSDTMHDIIVESSSAFIVNAYIYAYLKSGKRNWVASLSESFEKINR